MKIYTTIVLDSIRLVLDSRIINKWIRKLEILIENNTGN